MVVGQPIDSLKMLSLGVALLSVSGVTVVALFEAGGRVSVPRKHGMKTKKIRVVARKCY